MNPVRRSILAISAAPQKGVAPAVVRATHKHYSLTAGELRAAFEKRIRPEAWVQVVRGPTPK